MRRLCLILLLCFLLASLAPSWAGAGGKSVRINVDGEDWAALPPPIMIENRVFVPLRAIAAVLGADVAWNAASRTVNVRTPVKQGELYLQGLGNRGAEQPGIEKNFITAAALHDLLDDDRDGDLADYRKGHSGGDTIANDPLVVDVRARCDYDTAHIPGAIWVAEAAAMGKKENEEELRRLLANHVNKGGKDQIVLYCYTGHTAGLVAGVLGTRGVNVKNLAYGFDIAWTGAKTAPTPLKAPVEDKSGRSYVSAGG